MTVAEGTGGEPANVGGAEQVLMGKFHLAVVAFQRARQLKDNARPRVEVDGHKLHRIALMEVLAGAVPWSTEAE